MQKDELRTTIMYNIIIHYNKTIYKYAYNNVDAYTNKLLPCPITTTNKLTVFRLITSLVNL